MKILFLKGVFCIVKWGPTNKKGFPKLRNTFSNSHIYIMVNN